MGRNDSEGKDGDTRVEWVTIPPSIVYTEETKKETKKRILAVSTEHRLYSVSLILRHQNLLFPGVDCMCVCMYEHVCKCMSMCI